MPTKKLKSVTAPEGEFDYITGGKTYEVFDVEELQNTFFRIVDDDGDVISCMGMDCGHLDWESWILNYE